MSERDGPMDVCGRRKIIEVECDPLAVVTVELKRLAGDGSLPAVALTDKLSSTACPGRLWRPARIEIRREIAARVPSDASRGEIAHEYQ